MNEKFLKKRIKISSIFVVIILSIYLFYPFYFGELADGGSEVWKAKLYTVVHWHKLEPEENQKEWEIFMWPHNEYY